MRPSRSFDILLVEDSPGDARLASLAFEESGAPIRVHEVRDGVDAEQFLKRTGAYKNAPRPDLVLLDLNLPRRSGHEVLARIKEDPGLRRIPVIVLTTSGASEDVGSSYDLHANCYVKKPHDLDEFIAVVESIISFWFRTALLPRDAGSS